MTKEEEKIYLRESIFDYMEISRIEMDNLSSKCLAMNPNTLEFVEASSKFGGYFSMKTWLYNNSSCERIDDFLDRIHAFEEILKNDRNQEIERYMEGAFWAEANPFNKDKCLEAFQKCGINNQSTLNIQEEGIHLFQKALNLVPLLLEDSDIQNKEEKCNFQLYGGKINPDLTATEFYQVIRANHECLSQLKQFYDSRLKELSSYKAK